jgi:DNA-binding XRE family transcriptional regulator
MGTPEYNITIPIWHDHSLPVPVGKMELNETIAMNVLRARQEQGLTQEELADRAGLSNRYIGAIERATVSISITVLAQVAAALNLEPADLLHQG